jgi:hypothetical protein
MVYGLGFSVVNFRQWPVCPQPNATTTPRVRPVRTARPFEPPGSLGLRASLVPREAFGALAALGPLGILGPLCPVRSIRRLSCACQPAS